MFKNSHFYFNAQKVTICNNFLTTFLSYAIILSWLYKASLMLTHYCNANALLPTT
nr:MAG TPA: hypothetical protein [Bacteriophage sp.]